jgi:hypothetical protein
MLPDTRWAKREKEGEGHAVLTLERARQLHAAIAVRNYGIWSLILTAYAAAEKVDGYRTASMTMWAWWAALAVLFCVYLCCGFYDKDRNQSVEQKFTPAIPTPRHLLEAIAIPVFYLGFFCLLILLVLWKPAEMDPASLFYEPIGWFFWTIRYTPWMGLTAAVCCLGAWLRWRQASLEVLGASRPKTAT